MRLFNVRVERTRWTIDITLSAGLSPVGSVACASDNIDHVNADIR
ncbi:hypothetical protein EDC54_11293 [Samsonia erythrinae]|uniref:Uncharacterized protein n=1 Tax=Samsonia erythrinae TaxID=160434 RepID=A0A4R3VJN7_9GAMM|nr:hypothetical protein EDC54_11293 [Samsonia erythrinae]